MPVTPWILGHTRSRLYWHSILPPLFPLALASLSLSLSLALLSSSSLALSGSAYSGMNFYSPLDRRITSNTTQTQRLSGFLFSRGSKEDTRERESSIDGSCHRICFVARTWLELREKEREREWMHRLPGTGSTSIRTASSLLWSCMCWFFSTHPAFALVASF